MKTVNVHEAKTHLSKLIDEAEAGEDIIIARGGKPAVRLTALPSGLPGKVGLLKGKFVVPDNFDEPLPGDLLDLFEGKSDPI